MITEDYVSFETAKLLKEKGFEGDTNCYYIEESVDKNLYYSPIKQNHNKRITNNEFNVYIDITSSRISAPTLQMAMKWLREVHNILIVVDYEWECDTTPYYFKIYRLGENGKPEQVPVKGVSYYKDDNPTEHIIGYRDWKRSNNDYKKYEQACEAGIKYSLENLI